MKVFSVDIGVHLHGLDLVLNKEDGKFYLIDCNYFSTYNDVFNSDPSLCNLIEEHIE